MAISKSKVHEENIGRARANFQELLGNVRHFGIDSVLRHICCHTYMLEDRLCQRHLIAPKSIIRRFRMKNKCRSSVTFEFGSLKNSSFEFGSLKKAQVEGSVSATLWGSVHLSFTLEQQKATAQDLATSMDGDEVPRAAGRGTSADEPGKCTDRQEADGGSRFRS